MKDKINFKDKEKVKEILDGLDSQIGHAYHEIVQIIDFRMDTVTPFLREAAQRISEAKEALTCIASYNE